MTGDGTVTVELGVREARALVNSANLMGEVWEGVLEDERALPAGVSPLRSGAMRLEMALVLVGAEI